MLEVLLLHLHATGWQYIDIDRLVTVYVKFAWAATRCVYGGSDGHSELAVDQGEY